MLARALRELAGWGVAGLAVLTTRLAAFAGSDETSTARLHATLEHELGQRTAELEQANLQMRAEIAKREKLEADVRRKETFLTEVQRLSRTRSWISPIPKDPQLMSGEKFHFMGLDHADPSPPFSWIWDVVHADDRERVQQVVTAAILARQPYELEHRILLADGTVRIVHAVARPVIDETGAVTEYIGTSTDVTKRRAAEAELRKQDEELRKSELRYRNIFELSGVAIVEEDFTKVMAALDDLRTRHADVPRWLDAHPEVAAQTLELVQVTDANLAAARLFGAESTQEFLDAVPRLTTPEIRAAWVGQLRAIAEGKRIVETELVLTTLQNEKVTTIVTLVLPPPSSGYEKVLVTIVDLTERQRAQEALQQTQATLAHATRVSMLGELTASIAHEVNQPLGAILNNAHASLTLLAAGTPAELDEARAAIADIVMDGERASAVIERVRALARRSPPARERLQLADVVEDVVALTARELARRGVTVRRNAVAPLPSVLGDRVQLQQVLLNLVVNGMDAMASVAAADRILEIVESRETLDGRAAATIRVQDRGVGLNGLDPERVFEPFYTTKENGMGMGLAISRSIIQAHGGRMWVESNSAPGATFGFTLLAAD